MLISIHSPKYSKKQNIGNKINRSYYKKRIKSIRNKLRVKMIKIDLHSKVKAIKGIKKNGLDKNNKLENKNIALCYERKVNNNDKIIKKAEIETSNKVSNNKNNKAFKHWVKLCRYLIKKSKCNQKKLVRKINNITTSDTELKDQISDVENNIFQDNLLKYEVLFSRDEIIEILDFILNKVEQDSRYNKIEEDSAVIVKDKIIQSNQLQQSKKNSEVKLLENNIIDENNNVIIQDQSIEPKMITSPLLLSNEEIGRKMATISDDSNIKSHESLITVNEIYNTEVDYLSVDNADVKAEPLVKDLLEYIDEMKQDGQDNVNVTESILLIKSIESLPLVQERGNVEQQVFETIKCDENNNVLKKNQVKESKDREIDSEIVRLDKNITETVRGKINKLDHNNNHVKAISPNVNINEIKNIFKPLRKKITDATLWNSIKYESEMLLEKRKLLDNLGVYNPDLHGYHLFARSYLLKSSYDEIYERKRQIVKQLNNINNILNLASNDKIFLTIKEIAIVSLCFERISENLSYDKSSLHLKELTKLLSQSLKSIWAQKEKHEQVEIWTEKQRSKFRPGTEEDKNVSVGVSAGCSALSLPGNSNNIDVCIEGGINTQFGYSAAADDDGGIFTTRYNFTFGKVNAQGKAKLTNNIGFIAGVGCQFGRTSVRSKYYGGPKEYVQKEWHNLSSRSRLDYCSTTKNSQTLRSFNINSEVKQLDKIHQQAVNGKKSLNNLMKGQLSIENTLHSIIPEYNYVLENSYQFLSRKVKLEANANLLDKVSLGASVTLNHKYGDIWIRIPKPFSESIKENDKRLQDLPKNYYQHAENLIANIPSENRVGASITGLELLKTDLEKYFDTVRDYDYLKSKHSRIDVKKRKQYRKIKHEIEQRWGAIGRHQFIQFAAASHAYFSNNIVTKSVTMKPDKKECATALISKLAQQIYKPSIEYSPNRLAELLHFDKQFLIQCDDKTVSVNINVGPISGLLNIKLKKRLHPNICREGEYIDVSFTIKENTPKTNITVLEKLNDQINKKIAELLSQQGIAFQENFNLTLDIDSSLSGVYMLRLFKPNHDQYMGESYFRKSFSRHLLSTERNNKLSVKTNIAPAVSIGADMGIGLSNTHVCAEILGVRDLTYPTLIYNCFYGRNENDPKNSEWLAFEQEHNEEFKELYRNLGNVNERIYKDAQILLDHHMEIADGETEIKKAKEFKKAFTNSMVNVFNQPDNEEYIRVARDKFNTLLENQVPLIKKAFIERLKDKPSKLKANSALSFGSKIKKLFTMPLV